MFVQYSGVAMRLRSAWVLGVSGCVLAGALGAQRGQEADFAARFGEGQRLMASGDFEQAYGLFKQLEKMDGSVAEVHASLGVIDYQRGAFGEAAEEIRMARKLKPGLPNLDALLALSLAESGRAREALPGLERAYRGASDPAVRRQAGLELTAVYGHLQMERKAVETALELRDQYKNDPEVLYNASRILGNSAYLTIENLFDHFGATVWAHLAEAEEFESQGRTEDAVRAYQSVLEIDPHRPNVHYRMGRTYLARWKESRTARDVDAAAAAFGEELRTNPSNANAAYELADIRSKAGDDAEAERLYRAAVEIYPDFQEAQTGLGGVLLRLHRAPEAVEALERATKLNPQDRTAWYRLAQAEHALGKVEEQRAALARYQQLRAEAQEPGAVRVAQNAADAVSPQEIGADETQH